MKKLFSIIMCVLMVMCFMPTAAFAETANYGTIEIMASNGDMVTLADGHGLASNEATTATTISGNSYVAKYSGGKLYLKDYNVTYTTDSTTEDLYAIKGTDGKDYGIVVESDSSIEIVKSSTSGNVGGIYVNGYLTISGSEKLTIDVTNNGATGGTNTPWKYAYGIYAYKGLVASAPLVVKAKVNVDEICRAYGIYAYTGKIDLSDADKVINAVANSYQYDGADYFNDACGIYNLSSSGAASYYNVENNGNLNITCNLKIETGGEVAMQGICTGGDIEINGANVTISSSVMEKGMQTTNGNIKVSNGSKVNIDLANNYSNGLLAGNEAYSEQYDAVLFDGRGTLDIENSTVNVSSGSWSAKVKNVDIKNSNASFTTTYLYESAILTKDDIENYIDLSGYGNVTLKSCDYQYTTYTEEDKAKFKEQFGEDPKPAYTAGLLNHVKLGSYTYVQTGTTDSNAIEGAVRILGTVTDENEPTVTTAVISHLVRRSSSSTTKTDNVSNVTETTKTESGTTEAKAETKATVKAETKTAADGTKTTTATVDTTTASKIVEKAVENKSEEVVVTTAATPVAETAAGTTTEVAIPAETVSQIAEKTTAAVTIESEAAKVTLDQEAVAAVAETAGEAGTVSLVVETKAQDENKVEVDLKIETSNGTVSDFKGGTVSVTVKLNSALAAKPVMCVYIDDNGVYHKVAGQKNADGTYTFQTGHFSTYAILPEEEADAVIAKQADSAKEDVKALSLKASSTKTKKGNIKVTLKVDDEKIQNIEALGYTVKYKFYRSTKKASSYKAKFETAGKTYTNTAGKKGTRYYYKARVMVYDSDGTLVTYTALKQCRYATRIK